MQQALGNDAVVKFNDAIPTDEHVSLSVEGAQMLLEHDAWQLPKDSGYGRTLTIRHPAYRDPVAHLA